VKHDIGLRKTSKYQNQTKTNYLMRKTLTILLIITCTQSFSQEIYNGQRSQWLSIAEEFVPELITSIKRPVGIVTIKEDQNGFQGYSAIFKSKTDSYFASSMKRNSGEVLDFGEHLTGFVSVTIEKKDLVVDAPIRLKFIFAEVPAESVSPFDPYEGYLSRSWLQDEIITVTEVPITIEIPRRVSFRYARIEYLGGSSGPDCRISDLFVKATTSARNKPVPLATETPEILKKIDDISLKTLKECMQTVYEDGPKRDRRLWIGDLYLESLANTYTYKNDSLTKRCLYLIAGLTYEDGVVPPTIFERPIPHPQNNRLFDYSLIFNVVLKDYLTTTNDEKTARDLWPVVLDQIKIPLKYLDKDGLVDYESADKDWWIFFDWKNELQRHASLQGCIIWAYKNTFELAKMLNKENEVAWLPDMINKMTTAAQQTFYDQENGVYTSGPDKQVSYASQAWMVLSGVASKKEGANAFKNLSKRSDAIQPGTPYLNHYIVEAMIMSGLGWEAKNLVISYWGSMIEKGADTFWEVYVPDNEFASPYNSCYINSYCHAWSCTPTYFIRKYPEIFQNQVFSGE
jgi:hypothetical protein